MGDWSSVLLPPFPIVWTMSPEAVSEQWGAAFGTLASQAVTVNQAYFYPFRLDIGATAVKMAAMNGASVSGNTDVGIYDGQFNYLISSGATLQAGTNAIQEFDITDTYLAPGLYWMALSNSGPGTFFERAGNADEIVLAIDPGYQQASAHPLPTTTATPVISTEISPVRFFALGVSFSTLI